MAETRDHRPLPEVPGLSAVATRSLAVVFRRHGTIEKLRAAIEEFAGSLGRTEPAIVLAATCELARDLAAGKRRGELGPYEVERLVACARVAGGKRVERALVELVLALPDGAVRGAIVSVLLGWQTGMKPAVRGLAVLLDDEDAKDELVLRGALFDAYASSPGRARTRWREILVAATSVRSGRPVTLAGLVLDEIQRTEEKRAWTDEIAPLVVHPNDELATSAQRMVARTGDAFLAFLGWVSSQPHSRKLLAIVDRQIYWAMLDKELAAADLAAPLGALRDRAAETDRASAGVLTRAMQNLGLVVADRGARALGEPVARIGTEGGPALLVPTQYAKAWLGAHGPKPFDTGESDYERGCDLRRPAMIAIGNGRGVVLDGSSCNVFVEPAGVFVHVDGELAHEVAKSWKSIGTLAVGRGGLVVLDSAEAGAGKHAGINRATIKLAAGTYDVLVHRPRGTSTTLSAVRLVRR